MLFLGDNGGRVNARGAAARGPERAARSSYGFDTLVTRSASVRRHCCPWCRLTTSNEASRPLKGGSARFPAAAPVIAPATDVRTPFRSIVPALGPIEPPGMTSIYLVCAWRWMSRWRSKRVQLWPEQWTLFGATARQAIEKAALNWRDRGGSG